MRTDAFGQEAGHFEVRISKQCRQVVAGSHYLGQERAVAIAYQYVGLFLLAPAEDAGKGFGWMQRQVGGEYCGLVLEALFQGLGRYTYARGKESM